MGNTVTFLKRFSLRTGGMSLTKDRVSMEEFPELDAEGIRDSEEKVEKFQ